MAATLRIADAFCAGGDNGGRIVWWIFPGLHDTGMQYYTPGMGSAGDWEVHHLIKHYHAIPGTLLET
ncbi:hypothetical protein [Halomonas sp.]|uniref:hypothetical protein n=1 Tax=Halomonas sp. TaxID=1486246 RepID=UPI003A0FBAA6